jgi:hypothetical protein
MTRLLFCAFALFVATATAIALFSIGYVFPVMWGRLFLVWALVTGCVLLITIGAAVGTFQTAYHFACGRRDMSKGISCIKCGRLAFPVEGTTERYRCPLCAHRFDGPLHLP